MQQQLTQKEELATELQTRLDASTEREQASKDSVIEMESKLTALKDQMIEEKKQAMEAMRQETETEIEDIKRMSMMDKGSAV